MCVCVLTYLHVRAHTRVCVVLCKCSSPKIIDFSFLEYDKEVAFENKLWSIVLVDWYLPLSPVEFNDPLF